MVLSGKATRTQEAYIGSVVSLARYYKLSPEQLSVEEVRHYLLHRLRERHLARSSVYHYGCAYRFLYGTVLGLDGHSLLPEVAHLPDAGVRQWLRLSELCWLRVADIDSHADRMCICVEQGKAASTAMCRCPKMCCNCSSVATTLAACPS